MLCCLVFVGCWSMAILSWLLVVVWCSLCNDRGLLCVVSFLRLVFVFFCGSLCLLVECCLFGVGCCVLCVVSCLLVVIVCCLLFVVCYSSCTLLFVVR